MRASALGLWHKCLILFDQSMEMMTLLAHGCLLDSGKICSLQQVQLSCLHFIYMGNECMQRVYIKILYAKGQKTTACQKQVMSLNALFVHSGKIMFPQGNTFQAILITDGSKSYAVYSYRCGDLTWSDPATIGFNAPQENSNNHFLSGLPIVDEIACLQQESVWKNLIYGLEMNTVILPVTPEPSAFLGKKLSMEIHTMLCKFLSHVGSCVAAGFTECCTDFDCTGRPVADCFCDSICFLFGDCCSDIDQTCTSESTLLIMKCYCDMISCFATSWS